MGKGGIIIGIHEKIKHMGIEIDKYSKEFESLWVNISNNVNKIKIGCIYAPQESRTDITIYQKMYKHIKSHILESAKKGEKIFMTGDYNCKIGDYILGNKEEVSKSGKLLKEMVLEQNLTI